MSDTFIQAAANIVVVAQCLHEHGWLMGTSGNVSVVVDREPLYLAITPSGADKGALSAQEILSIDDNCKVFNQEGGKPSDESPLHVAIVKTRGAGAVIHTHSVWVTVLSDVYFEQGGVAIEGYEMLKGLRGVATHQHREWVPIVDNSQDLHSLAESVNKVLISYPETHAFLLRRHGLYTWGRDLKEAKRHVEILEFLFEAIGRSRKI